VGLLHSWKESLAIFKLHNLKLLLRSGINAIKMWLYNYPFCFIIGLIYYFILKFNMHLINFYDVVLKFLGISSVMKIGEKFIWHIDAQILWYVFYVLIVIPMICLITVFYSKRLRELPALYNK
jgi:hypothetical protein